MLALVTARWQLGATIQGKYRIERVLGEGGMGVVYAARHVKLDRHVAIKVMHASFAANETAVRRFFDEARAAGSLRHPNVIDVVDVDSDDANAPFMVMELLEGESLAAFLTRRGPVPANEVVALLEPVLDGLAAAHARGIVHRDLKPDNIFLARVGATVIPKILDFGIAKLRDPQRTGTATGAIVGTPMFMAPEQAAGTKDIGPWVDVWAMGALFFEAITGRPHLDLPADPNVMAILSALATQTPRRMADVAPAVPAPIASAIDAALVPDPAARLRSIVAFRAALRGEAAPAGSEVIPVTMAGAAPAPASIPRTAISDPGVTATTSLSRVLFVAAIAVILVTSIGVFTWSVLRSAAPPPPMAHDRREVATERARPELTEANVEPPQLAPSSPIDDDAPEEDPSTSVPAPGVDPSPEPTASGATRPRTRTRAVSETPSETATRTGTWNPDDL
jgi:serine/threonine-protein kinase